MPDRSPPAADYADHETEIVLGNKQLFSLLFVVFVLLGVFFAMGYVMGRSTLPVDTANSGQVSGSDGTREPARSAGGDSPSTAMKPSASTAVETAPAPE